MDIIRITREAVIVLHPCVPPALVFHSAIPVDTAAAIEVMATAVASVAAAAISDLTTARVSPIQ